MSMRKDPLQTLSQGNGANTCYCPDATGGDAYSNWSLRCHRTTKSTPRRHKTREVSDETGVHMPRCICQVILYEPQCLHKESMAAMEEQGSKVCVCLPGKADVYVGRRLLVHVIPDVFRPCILDQLLTTHKPNQHWIACNCLALGLSLLSGLCEGPLRDLGKRTCQAVRPHNGNGISIDAPHFRTCPCPCIACSLLALLTKHCTVREVSCLSLTCMQLLAKRKNKISGSPRARSCNVKR